jgi:hypothetical protein
MGMNNDLRESIEQLRKKMISVGMSKGFTCDETIKLSKMLDHLINLQMRKVPA